MFEKILQLKGLKTWWLILLTVFSFALAKSFFAGTSVSVFGALWLVVTLGFGLFYWLIFEVLMGFFYGALKEQIGSYIEYSSFINLFRFFIIFFNIFMFGIFKLVLLIDFYANFVLLFVNIIFTFLFLLFMWLVIKCKILKGQNLPTKTMLIYFSFGFLYLFLSTIMWGAL